MKMRKHTRNVTIRGGESSFNGQAGQPAGGSGVDAYAGGESFIIEDLLVENNDGNGIYMKSGPLFYKDFGTVGRAQISGVRARGNRHGLDINRSGGDLIKPGADKLPPLAADFVVIGGVYEDNTAAGIYVRGRNVSMLAPIVRNNHQVGIDLASAWDVSLIGVLVSGNGSENPGHYPGIRIGVDPVRGVAERVVIQGGVINGLASDDLIDGHQSESEMPMHSVAIEISDTANNITVDSAIMVHFAQPNAILSHMPEEASLIVHYGNHLGGKATGGPGSTRVNRGVAETKVTPVTDLSGWQPVAVLRSGVTDGRPINPPIGTTYFDTSLGKPVWWTGDGWTD
jgi:hypothetical protein